MIVSVSLIVSTYNRKERLMRLLESLERQRFDQFEVIAADDGSSDGTQRAVYAMCRRVRYPLRIVTQEHLGYRLARSRNNAIRVARGRQLVLIDDDCLPGEDCLRAYHEAFSPNHVLRSEFLFVPSADRLDHVVDRHLATQGLWGGNFSIATDLIREIGGFDEEFVDQAGEDTDFERRLSLKGVGSRAVSGAHVYHIGTAHSGGMPNTLYGRVKRHETTVVRNGGPLGRNVKRFDARVAGRDGPLRLRISVAPRLKRSSFSATVNGLETCLTTADAGTEFFLDAVAGRFFGTLFGFEDGDPAIVEIECKHVMLGT